MENARLAAQPRLKFQEQLGIGRTKYYELKKTDPRFPQSFEIGGKEVLYIHECNEYVRLCAESSRKEKSAA